MMLGVNDPPLRTRVMPQLLAEALESAIVFGELAPGGRIIEEEIAARYDVSRSPVRDALRRLETDGLVVRMDHRGARVSPISRLDLDEVYLCRIELEGLAAQQAAKRWQAPADRGFSDQLTAMRRAFNANNVKGYFLANVAFTDAVHRASGNATLQRLLKSISKQALRYRYLAYRTEPKLMRMSIEGNRDIAELILARKGARARRITAQLIEDSWRAIRNVIPDA
jgi:GntR family transcriptional regulator, rspAB operon transcriptional repressor